MSLESAPPLSRRLLAEFLGAALLGALVIGSGIAAQNLSPNDAGLQLLENGGATAAGLFTIILMFGPLSGGHFNPVVSRASAAHLLAEVIATAGLLLLIFALARSRRSASAPAAVGAYIGAAYFFTSSTSSPIRRLPSDACSPTHSPASLLRLCAGL